MRLPKPLLVLIGLGLLAGAIGAFLQWLADR